jgi:hypothetical protein
MASQHNSEEICLPHSEHASGYCCLVSSIEILDKTLECKLMCTRYSYSWANEVCAGDNEERAVVISSMNGFQYAVAAWLPIVIFPQTMAPTFRKLYNPACLDLNLLLTHAL